ncbi:MAG TPA: hypothetical protein VFU32_00165 [Ktedonobacterales bacterium]|nr:hypothetical protein [Ktedonobacterales bacterium]
MTISIIKTVRVPAIKGPLEGIFFPNGEEGASLRSLCTLLTVARHAQAARIKRNPALAPGLRLAQVELPEGTRVLDVLLDSYIALFITTLQVSRLSPDAQEVAHILQTQAGQAIAKAFAQPQVAESDPIPTAPAPEILSVQGAFDHIQHGFEALQEGLGELQEGFEELKEGFGGLKEHVVGMDQRIVIVEQDRLGRRLESGARFSAAQIGQLFMQLALLREQTGLPIEEAEKQLADQFGVAHIIDIDASKWPALHHAILALFQR